MIFGSLLPKKQFGELAVSPKITFLGKEYPQNCVFGKRVSPKLRFWEKSIPKTAFLGKGYPQKLRFWEKHPQKIVFGKNIPKNKLIFGSLKMSN